MALNLLTRGATVLRDVAAPAEVVITPAGVYVVLSQEHGDRADLREHVRTVREHLDSAGLRALPAEGLLCTVHPGQRARRAGDVVVGDLDAVNLILLIAADENRFGLSTIRNAVTALTPMETVAAPPWIATVAEPEPVSAPAPAQQPVRSPVAHG